MTNLAGLHDRESTALGIPNTWVLDTVALSENPVMPVYDPAYAWIARLNWGYGSTGTLPLPKDYLGFAEIAQAYVRGSKNCHRWIIGNEPNLSREWPDGQPIFPHLYAQAYQLARGSIRAIPGHERDEVLIAAPGPWNDQLKYGGNPNGDWIQYFMDVLKIIDDDCDGFSLHAYTHGYSVTLVTSEARMQSPFQSRHYEFRTYQDYMAAIPVALRHLPVYITEANGNGPWQAVGLMPAMLGEIDAWNKQSKHEIHCVIFYRFPKYDDHAQFAIDGKVDVIAEYQAAVGRGFTSPVNGSTTVQEHTFLPSTPNQGPSIVATADLPPRDVDPRAESRSTHILEARNRHPGQQYWRVKRLYTPNEDESDRLGPDHHILANVLVDGQRQVGVPLLVTWGGGGDNERTTIHTKQNDAFAFSADQPLSPGDFMLMVADGKPSEIVRGIKMGAFDAEGRWNPGAHTSTLADFELVIMPVVPVPTPVNPAPIPTNPSLVLAGTRLIWPTDAPRTQRWGENPLFYQEKVGIPYHNGIDHGAAEGTAVRAMADGEVMFVAADAGYGNYVRVYHPALGIHTFVAHLSRVVVAVGDRVLQGQVIAYSGATGFTAGRINPDGSADQSQPFPHTHTEVRLGGRDAYAEGTFGHSNGRVDPEAAMYLINQIVRGSGAQAESLAIIEPLLAEAVLNVESNGDGFEGGRLKIRFEAHIWEKVINSPALFARHFRYNEANVVEAWYRLAEGSPWIPYHEGGQAGEWAALELASSVNRTAALLATSMGAPQIMGFHHADIGYSTPQAMFDAFGRSVNVQIIGFFNFCIYKRLIDPMRRKDLAQIVRLYNGVGLEAIYLPRLVEAYREVGGD